MELTLNNGQLKRICKLLNKAIYLDSKTIESENKHFDIFSADPIDSQTLTLKPPNQLSSSQLTDFQHFCSSVCHTINNSNDTDQEALPFTHGLIGFCSYNTGEELTLKKNQNPIPKNNKADDFPAIFVGFYTWSYVFNHTNKKGFITFSPFCSQALRKKIVNCIKLTQEQSSKSTAQTPKSLPDLHWYKSQTFAEYAGAFERIQDYIKNGDCYQVNLTQRFQAKSSEHAADLYFATRENIQTPYSCFFSFSETQHLLSFSPEQFISIHNRTIESRPIKGTIKNNGLAENKTLLLNSTKNQAENVMIVDLLRNDLGKVCQAKSVHVPELFKVETYKNVHHLVSHIKGKLKPDVSEMDAFLSCFPGGSITGAPKIRSMEIIKELEKHSRSAYCGSVFYLNHDGHFDSNILIRTVIKHNEDLYCWAGGGIVADSELEDEYQESLTKVSNITGIHD